MNAWRRLCERRRIKREFRWWSRQRSQLEYYASNGARISKEDREYFQLPDWTG